MPGQNAINLEPGIYTLIEPALPNEDPKEMDMSDLLEPWIKDDCAEPGWGRKFNHMELANTNQIKKPAIVVPDLDNVNNKAFLRMIPKSQWGLMFDDWLESEHTRDFDEEQSRD